MAGVVALLACKVLVAQYMEQAGQYKWVVVAMDVRVAYVVAMAVGVALLACKVRAVQAELVDTWVAVARVLVEHWGTRVVEVAFVGAMAEVARVAKVEAVVALVWVQHMVVEA